MRPAMTAALALALALAGCASLPAPASGPLLVYGNRQTIEIAPVLVAAADTYGAPSEVRMGGVMNLVGEPGAAGFSDAGEADVATNAETQLLRYSVRHPELRIIAGVSEGLYRIVARRSAGIASVADLKGKAVAVIPQTSSGYFLQRMLEREGLGIGDVDARPIVPLAGMTEALAKREVDAVVIWEPESQNAAEVLGDDLVEFPGDGVYRELFNLNSTAENLADPDKRARIVAFVAALLVATDRMKSDPARAKALVTEAGGFEREDVEASWPHHRFGVALPADLLDVLVAEEAWLAALDKRAPRQRDELAGLIDASVYQDAMEVTK